MKKDFLRLGISNQLIKARHAGHKRNRSAVWRFRLGRATWTAKMGTKEAYTANARVLVPFGPKRRHSDGSELPGHRYLAKMRYHPTADELGPQGKNPGISSSFAAPMGTRWGNGKSPRGSPADSWVFGYLTEQ
jgi:hypothetical protein